MLAKAFQHADFLEGTWFLNMAAIQANYILITCTYVWQNKIWSSFEGQKYYDLFRKEVSATYVPAIFYCFQPRFWFSLVILEGELICQLWNFTVNISKRVQFTTIYRGSVISFLEYTKSFILKFIAPWDKLQRNITASLRRTLTKKLLMPVGGVMRDRQLVVF